MRTSPLLRAAMLLLTLSPLHAAQRSVMTPKAPPSALIAAPPLAARIDALAALTKSGSPLRQELDAQVGRNPVVGQALAAAAKAARSGRRPSAADAAIAAIVDATVASWRKAEPIGDAALPAVAAPGRAPIAAAARLARSELKRLKGMQGNFAPVDLTADLSGLGEGDRRALATLVRAAKIMDTLFLRQVWAGNEGMLRALRKADNPLGRARLERFLAMQGPWDREDENKPFVPGTPAKPKGANFYPPDATKAEIERWIASLPEKERGSAKGFFTTIRRDAAGRLMAVPYSIEYKAELAQVAVLLRQAAGLTQNASLKDYLEKRAAAFLSDDYYASDVAWMKLDAPIDVTIGPYENYEDDWFNFKAAFEAFVGLRDEAETAKLQVLSSHLQWLEDNLPIDPARRNPKLGALAPISVINQIFSSGEAARGVMTAAFNLPNDERILREQGAKRTLLKNVQQAKFDRVLVPLAKLALRPEDVALVDFDAFFIHILMHELMHGLGPHTITVEGKQTTVRKAFEKDYSAFEEAKADISGLWALRMLIDKGVLSQRLKDTMYTTFLAGAFRTLRFGIKDSHCLGMAMQLNYLIAHGVVVINKDGAFSVAAGKIAGVVEALTGEIMTIQSRGDRAAAKAMLKKFGKLRPEVKAVLARAQGLPVDILPRHKTAEELLRLDY